MCPASRARWVHSKPLSGSNHARHARAEVSATVLVSLLSLACVSLAATPPVAPIHQLVPAAMPECIVLEQASAQCLALVRWVHSLFQARRLSRAHRVPPVIIKTERASRRACPAARVLSKTYQVKPFVIRARLACTALRRH